MPVEETVANSSAANFSTHNDSVVNITVANKETAASVWLYDDGLQNQRKFMDNYKEQRSCDKGVGEDIGVFSSLYTMCNQIKLKHLKSAWKQNDTMEMMTLQSDWSEPLFIVLDS